MSKFFNLAEFVHSWTADRLGLDNQPDPSGMHNIVTILMPHMDNVRGLLGSPIHIDSGYRSPALNKAVHGSRNSQHMDGTACDFICPGYGTPLLICRRLVEVKIPFDQLIKEYGGAPGAWVHISFSDGSPRGQVLTKKGSKTPYLPGLVT